MHIAMLMLCLLKGPLLVPNCPSNVSGPKVLGAESPPWSVHNACNYATALHAAQQAFMWLRFSPYTHVISR